MRSHTVIRVAQGDLTVDVIPASDKDEFGNALKGMSDQLNEVLGGINQAAEQVGTGSKEIADSSTSLSQGATEQAASLQEISASMTELNGQVKQNAESAGQADQLSNVARETAGTGVDQMKNMMIWKALFEAGIYTNVALPPAVPEGRSLLRTSYMATHTDEQLDRVLEIFEKVGKEQGVIS